MKFVKKLKMKQVLKLIFIKSQILNGFVKKKKEII